MTTAVVSRLEQAARSGSADEILMAGAAALQQGAQREAVAPISAALHAHPDNARLWQLAGLIHRDLEDLASSVQAFEQASKLWPEDAMIAHGHACVRFEAGLPASQRFNLAMRLAPANRSILLQHAAALIGEGQQAAAVDEINRELVRNPGWIQGHVALAKLRWAAGDHQHFIDSFEGGLLAAPRDPALWRAYVDVFLRGEQYERALPIIERARAAVGAHLAFDVAEATSRSELGEMEAASRLFEALANVQDPAFTEHRLRFLLRAGRLEELAAAGEESVARDSFGRAWPYLSIAWRLLGDRRWEWLEGDPSLVGVYDLSAELPPLDALADRLRAIHLAANQPLDQSVRGGTQTEGHLFQRIEPEIRMLRKAVVEAVERHVAQLPPARAGHPLLIARRSPIGFAGSWSVRLTGGGRHIDHVHPEGWLSSALYIALPASSERNAPDAGWLTLGQAAHLGVDLPPIRTIEPKPGRLVLFPSTMWHGTRPFDAGERLTVAFDVKRPAQAS